MTIELLARLFITEGNKFYDERMIPEALAFYSIAIQIQPDCYDAYIRRADLKIALQNNLSAIDDCNLAINIKPAVAKGYFVRGLATAEDHRTVEAITEFSASIDRNERDADALYNRGYLKYISNDHEGAIEDFNLALQIKPSLKNNYWEKSIELNRRIDRLNDKVNEFSALFNADPVDYMPCSRLITLETIAAVNRFLDHQINNNFKLADAYYFKGIVNLNFGEIRNAIDHFSQSIIHNPLLEFAHFSRGSAIIEILRIEKRVKDHYQKVKKGFNDTPEIQQDHFGHPEIAIEDFNFLIERHPDDPELFFYRGEAYYEIKDFTAAINDFTSSLNFSPNNLAAIGSRGNAKFQLNDLEGALEDYTLALEIDPHDTLTLESRAGVRTELENWVGALEDYSVLIDNHPDEEEWYIQRGIIYQTKGDLIRAKEDYKRALKINPENLLARRRLGMLST